MRILIKRSSRVYIFLVVDNEILLVKNWLGTQDWRLPGGGKKKSESYEAACIREIKEELGLNLEEQNLKIIHQGVWKSEGVNYRFKIMIHTAKINKNSIKLNKLELIDAAWFDMAKLDNLRLIPEITEAINNSGLVSKK